MTFQKLLEQSPNVRWKGPQNLLRVLLIDFICKNASSIEMFKLYNCCLVYSKYHILSGTILNLAEIWRHS